MSKFHLPEYRHRLSETDLRELERREVLSVDALITDAILTSRVSPAAETELRQLAKLQPQRARGMLLDTPAGAVDPATVAQRHAELRDKADAIITQQGKHAGDCTPAEYLKAVEAAARGEQ